MFKITLLLSLIFTLHAYSYTPIYTEFEKTQMALVKTLDSNETTMQTIEQINKKQLQLYYSSIQKILSDIPKFLKSQTPYQAEIYKLERIIQINKRYSNNLAVLRDQIQIKSYEVLIAQHNMVKELIYALEEDDYSVYEKRVNDSFVDNQKKVSEILDGSYEKVRSMVGNSPTLKAAKKNLEDLELIVAVNSDVIKNISILQRDIYKLNKYAKIGLISIALSIEQSEKAKAIDEYLHYLGLDIIKLSLILILGLIIYLSKSLGFKLVDLVLLRFFKLNRDSSLVLHNTSNIIVLFFIVLSVYMFLFIYNDFSLEKHIVNAFKIIYAILVTILVIKLVNSVAIIKLQVIQTKTASLKKEVINVAIKIINFVIISLGLLVVLHFAGVNLTAVLSGLGIGGLAVAFAARETLANFFGTISILASDIFSQGDWIVVDKHQGVIVEIGLRVTTIRTFDNALIAIPNATIANNEVKNWNKRKIGRRIKMKVGVTYSSKAKDIKNAVTQIREYLLAHEDISTENTTYEINTYEHFKLVSKDDSIGIKRTLLVYLDEFADSSINILIYCFTKTTDWDKWLATKEEILYKIMEILEENNLEFAFPSLSIYDETHKDKKALLEQI